MKLRFGWQHVIYLFLVAAFVYILYLNWDQIGSIIQTLGRGKWYVLAASVVILGLAMYNQAFLYTSIYRLLDLPAHRNEMLPLYLVRRFFQVAAPSGGFSGWVPFIQFARRHEISVSGVFVANLVYTILWYSTFWIFLLVGLIFLFASNRLEWYEVDASLVMFLADLIMIALLSLAWARPALLIPLSERMGVIFTRVFAWIKRPSPVSHEQLVALASDFNKAMTQMRAARMRRLMAPVAYALINETLHLSMLYLIALAFGYALGFGVVVAAYSISILFFVISPTPGGLGFVETTMILVLTALDLPFEAATVITLAYRGLMFWLPFVFGFMALRWFGSETVVEQHPGW